MAVVLKQIGQVTVQFDEETNKILKMSDVTGDLDFTDESRVHPVSLIYGEAGCTIINVYAVEQQVQVHWQDGVCGMLVDYLAHPAVAYRIINRMACKETIASMRKILASYAAHYSRDDAPEVRERSMLTIRILTTLGNADVLKKFNDVMKDDSGLTINQLLIDFSEEEHLSQSVIRLLELYFGYLNKAKLTPSLLVTVPLKNVATQDAPTEVRQWAFDNDIITKEQYNVE